MGKVAIIKPGIFNGAADSRRDEFDFDNEKLLTNETPIDVVFIGDSITHAWWNLDEYFGEAGLVLNRGIGGDITAGIIHRFDADVLQLKPRYCVLLIGINDTWSLDGNEQASIQAEPPDSVYNRIIGNYEIILKKAQAANQKVIICSVMPVYPFHKIRNPLVIKINNRLKALCKEYGLIFIDYHSAVTDSEKMTLRLELADDGLHPNALGYSIMAQKLKETISANKIDFFMQYKK